MKQVAKISGQLARTLLPLLVLTASVPGCAAGAGPDGAPVSEDRRITEEVLRIVAERDDIVAEDIEVETNDGVVVLSGVQADLEPVSELLRRVARVRGVVEVVNRIRIVRSRRGYAPGREDGALPEGDLGGLHDDERQHGDQRATLAIA